MSQPHRFPALARLFPQIAPALFVVLWSSGFIGAKFGLPYAEPFTFLLIRLGLVAVVLSIAALVARAPWPKTPRAAAHIAIAGLLVHGVYLGGVFAAIAHGLGAGLVALIVGLQPLITAAIASRFLGERVRPIQWAGLALGLIGVGLVVSRKVTLGGDLSGIPMALAALVGITIGTLYQKRFCMSMDLRSGTALQYMATSLGLAVLAYSFETMKVTWTLPFVLALLWLVLALSVGAIFLLFILIRQGQSARVASLFYLTPPVTACMAWALFGESLPPVVLIGFVVVALGVALARR
jgi:drug/metabolite transporter (DMT)-like permease